MVETNGNKWKRSVFTIEEDVLEVEANSRKYCDRPKSDIRIVKANEVNKLGIYSM